MTAVHEELASGRWRGLSFFEQMANVGSEVERALSWRNKGNAEYCRRASERALELLDLTIGDPKNNRRLRELARVRETFADCFFFDNTYQSTPSSWHSYFHAFTFAARLSR